MNNSVLERIKNFAVSELRGNYEYCGVMESDEFILINSDDKNGKDIKIKITLTNED